MSSGVAVDGEGDIRRLERFSGIKFRRNFVKRGSDTGQIEDIDGRAASTPQNRGVGAGNDDLKPDRLACERSKYVELGDINLSAGRIG